MHRAPARPALHRVPRRRAGERARGGAVRLVNAGRRGQRVRQRIERREHAVHQRLQPRARHEGVLARARRRLDDEVVRVCAERGAEVAHLGAAPDGRVAHVRARRDGRLRHEAEEGGVVRERARVRNGGRHEHEQQRRARALRDHVARVHDKPGRERDALAAHELAPRRADHAELGRALRVQLAHAARQLDHVAERAAVARARVRASERVGRGQHSPALRCWRRGRA